MPYDLFISYSRRDNGLARVTQLIDRMRADFLSFAGRPLDVFFDLKEIQGMDDWRQKIQESLRRSHLFLAVLSPNYLASPYCRWEWEDYLRYEAMRQCLGEGVAPVFFVTLPDDVEAKTDLAIAGWLRQIRDRQTFDLRPWHDAGEHALQQADVKSSLDQLQSSVRERLDRCERARHSPGNLIKHNPAFVGRVRELTELRSALVLNKLGVVGAREGQVPGRATVQGLGGMGKTELALAYAHAFAWDYPGGSWQISCEHVGDLRVALVQLAGPMKFEFTDDENKSLALAFERVLRELCQRERCLLLLDNVSDPSILEPEYLDRLPRDGLVDLIATTRLAPNNIPGSTQTQTFIAIDELPEEDALALLRGHQPGGRFPNQQEDDDARGIIRLLEGFTLAVETAAIYIGRHVGEVTCAQFLRDLRARLLEQSEEAAGDPTVAVRHRERLLEKTLAFTLEALSPEALHLLNLASLLPADLIALPWLQSVGAEQFASLGDGSEVLSSAFHQTVELLLGLRLLQTASVSNIQELPLVVRMHRLVQEILALHDGFPRAQFFDKLVQHAKRRCSFLAEQWLNWENRWEIEPLRALSEALLEREHSQASWIAAHVGVCLYELARYPEAEPLMRRALRIEEQHHGSEHHVVAVHLNNLALLLQDTNRLAEAEPLLRRALSIDEQKYGKEHPLVAIRLGNLAHLLQTTNRLDEAEPLLRRALAIDEQMSGPESLNVAIRLNNLTHLLQATNRMGEAEPLLRRALAIDERFYGPEHPHVAIRLNNLATLLQATNRLEQAEPLMRRTLAIDQHNYGVNHPHVARDLNNLATLLADTNRLSEAEPLMRRVLAIEEQVYGPEHPNVARDLNNLAMLLQSTNRRTEAEPLMRRALVIDEQSLGPEHPDVARDLNNLALLLHDTNRIVEAEPLLRRALMISEQSYRPDHPEVALRLNNLAQLLQATNRLAEAEPLMRRALAIDEQSCGAQHPDVGRDLNNLALLLQATNRVVEAEPLVRRALAISEQSYGPHHPEVATRLNNLAWLWKSMNRHAEAEPLMRRALAIDEQSCGSEHPSVARDLNSLGLLLQDTNRLAEAEPLLRRALAIHEQSYGPEHPNVAKDLNNLAWQLRATNRAAEAEPLMRRALVIDERNDGPRHPSVAQDLNSLGLLLHETNRFAEAEPLMRRALAISAQVYGGEHPEVAVNLNNLAQLLQAANRLEEAELLMRRALAIDEQVYGALHPEVAIDLNNLAQLLHATNRLAEAEPLMRRVVEIFVHSRATNGVDHSELQTACRNYAGLLQQMGRNQQEIRAQLDTVGRPFGMKLGDQ